MKHGRSIRELDAVRVNAHLGRGPERFVSLSESRFQLRIGDLAGRVLSEKEEVRAVLISGRFATGAEEVRRKRSYFSPLPERLVPKESLRREFIG